MNNSGINMIHKAGRSKTVMVHNLVFVVLFVLSLFGNEAGSMADTREVFGDLTCVHSNDSHKGSRHNHDLPFDSNDSLPGEQTNEKDLEEEMDDEDGKEFWNRSIAPGIAYITTESSGTICRQLLQNHHSVSLYILYHSWKSYLS